ncbi:MAG TPA: hypothetical protein PLN31_09630 [Azoarcus taiwanensis]|nr:hypothetical protein [Azoarcus taiwanensis]
MSTPARYLHRLLDATSQWCNVLLFAGEANHSISCDAYRLKRARLRRAIDWLFSPIEDRHCERSYLADVARARALVAEHEVRARR